jgi:hypothetical protein
MGKGLEYKAGMGKSVLLAQAKRIEELEAKLARVEAEKEDYRTGFLTQGCEAAKLRAKLARVEQLPDDWERLIGISTSSFGKKGDDELDSVFRDLAFELRQALEQDD